MKFSIYNLILYYKLLALVLAPISVWAVFSSREKNGCYHYFIFYCWCDCGWKWSLLCFYKVIFYCSWGKPLLKKHSHHLTRSGSCESFSRWSCGFNGRMHISLRLRTLEMPTYRLVSLLWGAFFQEEIDQESHQEWSVDCSQTHSQELDLVPLEAQCDCHL